MEEKNPLLLYPAPSSATNVRIFNKRGRPKMEKIIKFSPQPKSIVAQMFSELKNKSSSSITDDDEYSRSDHLNIDDVIQTSQSEEPPHLFKINNVEEFTCQTCSYRANGAKDFKKHLTTHQQFSCDYPNCTYSSKLSSNLIKHKRVHTNEKPYLCDRCSFRSNFVNSLKAHKRTHTAEKPYQCKNCSYKCNSSSNLKKHSHLKHPQGSNPHNVVISKDVKN